MVGGPLRIESSLAVFNRYSIKVLKIKNICTIVTFSGVFGV